MFHYLYIHLYTFVKHNTCLVITISIAIIHIKILLKIYTLF